MSDSAVALSRFGLGGRIAPQEGLHLIGQPLERAGLRWPASEHGGVVSPVDARFERKELGLARTRIRKRRGRSAEATLDQQVAETLGLPGVQAAPVVPRDTPAHRIDALDHRFAVVR